MADVVETVPDVAEVRRIAAIRDPVLRNLEITHCYRRLAGALARRKGAGANWCTFATWASRQAGSTIRGEDSVGLLRARLGRRAELLRPIASLWRRLLRRGLLDPTKRLGRVLLPAGTRARRVVPDRAGAALSGWVGARIERAGEAIAREVITRSLMVLSLPGRVLWLGTHLPDPYPEALREIDDEELAALLAVYEPVAPAGDDCGARDWSVLEQRMHYIVHLFRSWHYQADLSRPPFTPAQPSNIGAGVIPDGDL